MFLIHRAIHAHLNADQIPARNIRNIHRTTSPGCCLIRPNVRVADDLARLGNFVFEVGGEFFGRAARNFNRCCRPSFAHITRLQALDDFAGGQPGAELALTIFRDEISRVMALLGCNSVAELSREFLQDAETPLLSVPPARPELRVIDGAKM